MHTPEAVLKHPLAAEASRIGSAEQVCRLAIARHRQKLGWMLRIPEWEPLLGVGLADLELPQPLRGIGLIAVVEALLVEQKKDLVLWLLRSYKGQFRARTAYTLSGGYGLDVFDSLSLDEYLSETQLAEFREQLEYAIAREHRRYKHAQGLMFADYEELAHRMTNRIVFNPGKRADGLQEAAMGLLHAIDKVEPGDKSFGSYASSWIGRALRNYLIGERFAVHVPVNLASRLLEESARRARGEGGGQPGRYAGLMQPTRPLDAAPEDAAGSGVPQLADEDAPLPFEPVSEGELREHLSRNLDKLTDKQREVICLRYGLDGARGPLTLAAIAKRIGISHQQVSMREKRALQKLENFLRPVYNEW